jgi:hypothetical protein
LYVSPGADFETDWMTKRDIEFVARKYKEAAKVTASEITNHFKM